MESTTIQYVDRVVIKTGPNVANEAEFYENHPSVSPKVYVVDPGVEWRSDDGQLVMSHERMVHSTEIFSVEDIRGLVQVFEEENDSDFTSYSLFADHVEMRETWFVEDHGSSLTEREQTTLDAVVNFLTNLGYSFSGVPQVTAHGDLQTKNMFYRPVVGRLPGAIDPLPVVAPVGYDVAFYYATLFSEGSVMDRRKRLEEQGIWSELTDRERMMVLALMILDDNPTRISRTQDEWEASLIYVSEALHDDENKRTYTYPVNSDVHYIQSVTSVTE